MPDEADTPEQAAADGEPAADEATEDAEQPSSQGADDKNTAKGAAATATATATAKPKRHLPRRIIAWVLVVLVGILVPLSIVTAWTVTTLTNTDRYVATMSPIVREPVVTAYLGDRITTKLFTSLNVEQKLHNALPPKASFVAAPVTVQLENFTRTQVTKLLQSEKFAQFWDGANRRLHTNLVDVLTGKKTPLGVKLQKVGVDIEPAVIQAIDKLDAKGVTVFNPVKRRLQHSQLTFTLVNQDQLQKAQTGFRLAKTVGWALPVVVLILALITIIVGVDRRKTALRVFFAGALGCLVFQAFLELGRGFFVHHAKAPSDVTGTVWDTVIRYLHNGLHDVIVVCVLVVIALWLAGPSSWARWIWARVAQAARWVGRTVSLLWQPANRQKASSGAKRAARWMLEHAAGMRILGGGVGAALLLLGGTLSVGSVWLLVLLLAIYYILLEVVFAWARRLSAAAPDGGDGTNGADDRSKEEAASGAAREEGPSS